MKEVGIDISKNKAKSIFDIYTQDKLYRYVITVRDESNTGQCPLFPGPASMLHWSFENPARFTGTEEEKLGKVRLLRGIIRKKVQEFRKNRGNEEAG